MPARGAPLHAATLALDCGTQRDAEAVAAALAPEAEDGPQGATTAVRLEGATLVAELHAHDVSGLRAALNSVTRLTDAALRTLKG